jgi:Leucine-rich repeat (LRR) protein
VIGLDFNSSCLYGSINSNNSLFRLLQLQRLNLADNRFNDSQIPLEVGNLSRLVYLNLSSSTFSRQVPSKVSQLSKLSSLDLSGNFHLYSKSDLRSLVQNFTTLEELFLTGINFSSPIPKSLANLSSLTTLDLQNCWLHGEFPTKIFLLPNLRFLRVSHNQDLIGHLPQFHSSSSLEVLTLKNTSFSCKIPTSIGNLSFLTHLNVRDCNFSGSIPPSLTNLTQVIHLDLSVNILTGHIPNSFSQLRSLQNLFFDENNLNGKLDFDMFLKIKSLSVLMLSSNNLTLLTKANSNYTSKISHSSIGLLQLTEVS